jgi:hypothetical protein
MVPNAVPIAIDRPPHGRGRDLGPHCIPRRARSGGGRRRQPEASWGIGGRRTQRPTKRRLWPRATTMTYDATTRQVVLFGGQEDNGYFGDTWTWDGQTWQERHPATFPSGRLWEGLAYDASSGQVLLHGGGSELGAMADTWLWDGQTWNLQATTRAHVSPRAGAPGSTVGITASGFGANEGVDLTFVDSKLGKLELGLRGTRRTGGLRIQVTIPSNATPGTQTIRLRSGGSGRTVRLTFTVT